MAKAIMQSIPFIHVSLFTDAFPLCQTAGTETDVALSAACWSDLNKGCVLSPVPSTVPGCQPPMALLLDPAQPRAAGRAHPPDGSSRVSWAWGGFLWAWGFSEMAVEVGILFVLSLISLFWMKDSATQKPLPFTWPQVTSWNSSTWEAWCEVWV